MDRHSGSIKKSRERVPVRNAGRQTGFHLTRHVVCTVCTWGYSASRVEASVRHRHWVLVAAAPGDSSTKNCKEVPSRNTAVLPCTVAHEIACACLRYRPVDDDGCVVATMIHSSRCRFTQWVVLCTFMSPFHTRLARHAGSASPDDAQHCATQHRSRCGFLQFASGSDLLYAVYEVQY